MSSDKSPKTRTIYIRTTDDRGRRQWTAVGEIVHGNLFLKSTVGKADAGMYVVDEAQTTLPPPLRPSWSR